MENDKMTASKIDTEAFILEVKKRPALWNPLFSDYGKMDKKQQCWEELTQIFAPNMEENDKIDFALLLQKKWKNLRGCFTRELQRQQQLKSGSPRKRKNAYVYFSDLEFLKDVVRNNKNVEHATNMDFLEIEHMTECDVTASPQIFPLSPCIINEGTSKDSVQRVHDDDEYDLFGKSVVCHLRKLPESVAVKAMAHIHSYLTEQRLKECACTQGEHQ